MGHRFRSLSRLAAVVGLSALSACGHHRSAGTAVPSTLSSRNTALVSLTSRIARGGTGHLVAHTAGSAACTSTTTLSGRPVQFAGLGSSRADGRGNINLAWSVPADAVVGDYSISIACTPGGGAGAVFKVVPASP